jgi:hypothetical protein
MVIVSSNRIFITKRKNDNVNSISETPTVCPLCKSDDVIITDPKSGEIIWEREVVRTENSLAARRYVTESENRSCAS